MQQNQNDQVRVELKVLGMCQWKKFCSKSPQQASAENEEIQN